MGPGFELSAAQRPQTVDHRSVASPARGGGVLTSCRAGIPGMVGGGCAAPVLLTRTSRSGVSLLLLSDRVGIRLLALGTGGLAAVLLAHRAISPRRGRQSVSDHVFFPWVILEPQLNHRGGSRAGGSRHSSSCWCAQRRLCRSARPGELPTGQVRCRGSRAGR